jgi:PAS domain S-box-containing protein
MNPGSLATVWPYLATLGLLVALGLFSWRRRSVPGARPLAIASLFSALWVAGYAMELAAVDPAAEIFWFNFQATWIPLASIAITWFVLEYVWPGRWLTRRNLAVLAILAVILGVRQALILTNHLHHLMWLSYRLNSNGSVFAERGVAAYLATIVVYSVALLEFVALGWLFLHSRQHRLPVIVMLIGVVVARALWVLGAYGLESDIPPDVFSAPFALLAFAIALFGLRVFDPVQMARRQAIEQLNVGVVVLDLQGRVVSLNASAERILGVPAGVGQGRCFSELLPAYKEFPQQVPDGVEVEIQMREGEDLCCYTLAVSRLRDWRGMEAGRLLLLREVTERRRAEAQRLEQQWAQATLQERELLAQELHDGLAQDLGFLNMQAQAANLFLRSGQAEAAQHSLDRLTEIALETHGDTRELIGDLLTVSMPSEGLCSAVRHAVARFEQQTGLPVNLKLAEDTVCRSSALPPAAGVQLLRILQEALANVRKHAGCASQIGVQLMAKDGHLRMTVTDNGPGFDPAVAGAGGQHFGLQVMAQRAERVGGQLAVRSNHGHGTQVEVCVPLDSTIRSVRDEEVPYV